MQWANGVYRNISLAYKLTAFLDCRLRFYNLRAYSPGQIGQILLVDLKHMHDASILRFAQYHNNIIIIENAHSAGRRTKTTPRTTRNALTRAKYLSAIIYGAKYKGSQVWSLKSWT